MGDWRPQVESNHQLALRRGALYPFNYEGDAVLAAAHCNGQPGFLDRFCMLADRRGGEFLRHAGSR